MHFQVLNMVVSHKNMHGRLEMQWKGQVKYRGCIITQIFETASISRLNRNGEQRQNSFKRHIYTVIQAEVSTAKFKLCITLINPHFVLSTAYC